MLCQHLHHARRGRVGQYRQPGRHLMWAALRKPFECNSCCEVLHPSTWREDMLDVCLPVSTSGWWQAYHVYVFYLLIVHCVCEQERITFLEHEVRQLRLERSKS